MSEQTTAARMAALLVSLAFEVGLGNTVARGDLVDAERELRACEPEDRATVAVCVAFLAGQIAMSAKRGDPHEARHLIGDVLLDVARMEVGQP